MLPGPGACDAWGTQPAGLQGAASSGGRAQKHPGIADKAACLPASAPAVTRGPAITARGSVHTCTWDPGQHGSCRLTQFQLVRRVPLHATPNHTATHMHTDTSPRRPARGHSSITREPLISHARAHTTLQTAWSRSVFDSLPLKQSCQGNMF